MTKTTKLSIIFASVFVLFLALYLIVINPFAETDDYDSSSQVEYDPSVGEGVYLNAAMMYEEVLQNDIDTITIKNDSGIYRIYKIVLSNTPSWYLWKFNYTAAEYDENQADADNWTVSALVSLDDTKLASLRVAVGVTYYQTKITLDATAQDFEERLTDYGLTGDCNFFEFTATKDGESVAKRVYVGDYCSQYNNYYMRIEGTDRVYVASGDTSVLFAKAEYFVNPLVSAISEQYANYYMNDFSIYEGSKIIYSDSKGDKTVKAGDIVELQYYVKNSDGLDESTALYTVIDTKDENLVADMKNNLIGMEIGTTKEFTVTYPASYSEKIYVSGNYSWYNELWYENFGDYSNIEKSTSYQTTTDASKYPVRQTVQTKLQYVVRVTSIIRPGDGTSDGEVVKINWLNQSEREPFYQFTTYTATGSKGDYVINTNNFFSIVEVFEDIEGTEVVSLDLSRETIEKYGLDAYMIYYKTPQGIEYSKNYEKDEHGNYIKDSDGNFVEKDADAINICTYKYNENVLFLSEKQKDGSRYVGNWYYGIVVKVTDSETFFFLDWDIFEFIEEYMFSTEVKFMDEINFKFGYTDIPEDKKEYTFKYTHTFTDTTGDTYTSDVTLNGQKVDTSATAKLYTYISSLCYEGMCDDLTAAECEALYNDNSKCILELTFKLNSNAGKAYAGQTVTFRFCPYSSAENPSRHCLISNGDGHYFTVITSSVEKIYNDIQRILAGEEVNYNDKY